jgi:hypothetical protein
VLEGCVQAFEVLAVAVDDHQERVVAGDRQIGRSGLALGGHEVGMDTRLLLAEAHPVRRRAEELRERVAPGQHQRDRAQQRALAGPVLAEHERPLARVALRRRDGKVELLDRPDVVERDPAEEHGCSMIRPSVPERFEDAGVRCG